MPLAGAEARTLKEREREHRMRSSLLPKEECADDGHADNERYNHGRVAPADRVGTDDRPGDRKQAGGCEHEADDVEPRMAAVTLAEAHERGWQDCQPDRQVCPEDPLPTRRPKHLPPHRP